MPEPRPPTPATGDDSFSLGPTKKTVDAEFCTRVHFVAETYPGGEWLPHNLWFHESWSAFEAPMNILFLELKKKPMVLILPHAPEGTPKNEYKYEYLMKFHGPRPQRAEREPAHPSSQGNSHHADAGRPSFFQASTNRAREMANNIRLPIFRLPSARWWHHKVMLLLKTLLILVATLFVIALGLELVHHAPKLREIVSRAPELREIIAAKFAPVNQASSHTDQFNTGRDHSNRDRDHLNSKKDFSGTEKDPFDGDTHSLKTDRGRPKAAKGYPKTEKDNRKENKGHSSSKRDNIKKGDDNFGFDRNADGNHVHGSWTKPDDTHVTFEASKTSGGDVTEVKFVQSEEQFIKDESDTVLFSVNRITRFLVTLIGGDKHDEKLDKIMNGIGSMPSQGNKKARSRSWW